MVYVSYIPFFMVGIFLLLTLGLAVCFTRPNTTFRAYAVGHKRFPTAYLVGTVLATSIGGQSAVNGIEYLHTDGLIHIVTSLLVYAISYWLVSRLALRMAPFMQDLSMSETMGRVYGKYPRIITTLSHTCCAIVAIAMQVNIIFLAIRLAIGSMHPIGMTMLVIAILMFYTTVGGIRMVTITDLMQIIAFCVILPTLHYWVVCKAGKSLPEVIAFLSTQKQFQLRSLLCLNNNIIQTIMLGLAGLVTTIDPPTVQRIYMATDVRQANKVFINASIIALVIKASIILLGISTFIALSSLPVTVPLDDILQHIPPVLKGCVAIGLLAITMSTADSYLNSCSVMLSEDIVRYRTVNSAPFYPNQLQIAKHVAMVITMLAVLLSCYCNNYVQLIHLYVNCSLPIITAPFILAIFGFRGSSHTVLMGMATGAFSVIVWNRLIESRTGINGAFCCMLINGLAMLATHCLQRKHRKLFLQRMATAMHKHR